MWSLLVNIDWVLGLRSEWLTYVLRIFPFLVSDLFYFGLVAGGYWFTAQCFYRDLGVLITLSNLLNYFLKSIFKIPRPDIPYLVETEGTFGFPSGDIQVALMVWFLVARHFQKAYFWLISILVVSGIGFSRLYWGVHTPLDLFGGGLVGGICILLYERYKDSKHYKRYAEGSTNVLGLILMGILILYSAYMWPDMKKVWVVPAGALLGISISFCLPHFKTVSLKDAYDKLSVSILSFIFLYSVLTLGISKKGVVPMVFKASLMSLAILYFIPWLFAKKTEKS